MGRISGLGCSPALTYLEAVVRIEPTASIFASITEAWIGKGFNKFLPMRRSAAAAFASAAREDRILVIEPALLSAESGSERNSFLPRWATRTISAPH